APRRAGAPDLTLAAPLRATASRTGARACSCRPGDASAMVTAHLRAAPRAAGAEATAHRDHGSADRAGGCPGRRSSGHPEILGISCGLPASKSSRTGLRDLLGNCTDCYRQTPTLPVPAGPVGVLHVPVIVTFPTVPEQHGVPPPRQLRPLGRQQLPR